MFQIKQARGAVLWNASQISVKSYDHQSRFSVTRQCEVVAAVVVVRGCEGVCVCVCVCKREVVVVHELHNV